MIVLHSKLNITSTLVKTPGGGQAVNKNGGSNIFCVISKNQKWSWHSNGEKVKKKHIVSKIPKNSSIYLNL